ncbi:hypothetical protein ATP_00473 [Candidatus Phytoplasma mali]|uniref:Uncharacterized protein n=1 Tax=Phytoplasma mali (strain AT) TaxID=482235 RepID=B3R048_PHYMT|nr:hypothetical protein [Candidatus Phytoplasma mali]CAP18212.1 hypothetical protein ATP_00025 [Candidatus Phytoplasma mali]CAP18660.1 hypothetical protein ATP_00473 [Candidatus Phytoplasma mali]
MIKIILEKFLALIGLIFLLGLAFFWADGIYPEDILRTVINIPTSTTFKPDSEKDQDQLPVTSPSSVLPQDEKLPVTSPSSVLPQDEKLTVTSPSSVLPQGEEY